MEKNKLGGFLANAGSAAKGAFDKAKVKTLQMVDQNDDGKFDMSDISAVAGAVGGAMKKSATAVKESAEDNKRKMELKTLQPIFPETLGQTEFLLSKFLRVADRDKRHAESEVCQGSIGFLSDKGGLRVVNIFKDSLDYFGLSFYPNVDCEFYYVNPIDRDNYISLGEYFSYLKIVRINELQRVAMDLGAKHFRVTYKEENSSSTETDIRAQVKSSKIGGGEGERHTMEKQYSMVNVAAEMNMTGHLPVEPVLVYLAQDDSIQNLIHLRMTEGENFHSHRISIKMSSSSGIKESDAVKIDAAIKGMKGSGSMNISKQANSESRSYLEYEIDF